MVHRGQLPIPDLDAATEIVFSGTSAGGFGALQNADWFLQPLSARAGLVVDAAMDISPNVTGDYDLFAENTGLYYNDHRLQMHAARWAPGGYYAEIDAFVDESCSAEWPSNLEECVSPSKLLLTQAAGAPIITTPTFVRMDLPDLDEVVMGGSGGPTTTIDDYAAMMRDTMVEFSTTSVADIAVHAPKCGVHVGVELPNPFHTWTTPDSTDVAIPVNSGGDATAHDAILEWVVLVLPVGELEISRNDRSRAVEKAAWLRRESSSWRSNSLRLTRIQDAAARCSCAATRADARKGGRSRARRGAASVPGRQERSRPSSISCRACPCGTS